MKIHLAKTFFRVGDMNFNYNKIIEIYDKSVKENCDLLIFSEMSMVGFPAYDLVLNSEFIKKSDEYVEKIVDYTKGKKTRILLGCPYFIKGYVKDEVINKPELFNSMVLIDDGYIDAVTSKTSISKNNLFDEYKYFDKEVTLNKIEYENDNFDVLIADDIMENRNILYIKERDTDFIVCVDTEIRKNIEAKKKQLVKIAKWTNKNIIYLNNLGYDIKREYSFLGESFVVNNIGELIYEDTAINENIIKLETSVVNGKIVINFAGADVSEKNFINIIAENYNSKTIIYEITKETNMNFEKNVKLITFNKDLIKKDVEFIDLKDYININKIQTVDECLKNIVLKSIYKNYIYIKQ